MLTGQLCCYGGGSTHIWEPACEAMIGHSSSRSSSAGSSSSSGAFHSAVRVAGQCCAILLSQLQQQNVGGSAVLQWGWQWICMGACLCRLPLRERGLRPARGIGSHGPRKPRPCLVRKRRAGGCTTRTRLYGTRCSCSTRMLAGQLCCDRGGSRHIWGPACEAMICQSSNSRSSSAEQQQQQLSPCSEGDTGQCCAV